MFHSGVSVSFAMFVQLKKLSPTRQTLDVSSVREY